MFSKTLCSHTLKFLIGSRSLIGRRTKKCWDFRSNLPYGGNWRNLVNCILMFWSLLYCPTWARMINSYILPNEDSRLLGILCILQARCSGLEGPWTPIWGVQRNVMNPSICIQRTSPLLLSQEGWHGAWRAYWNRPRLSPVCPFKPQCHPSWDSNNAVQVY